MRRNLVRGERGQSHGLTRAICISMCAAQLLLGCDEPAEEVDAGRSDAGPVRTDAGAPATDAGDTDAGAPPTDAGDTDAGPPDAGPVPVTECSTTATAALNGMFFPLCETDDPVRHVRIEGVVTAQPHGSAQVVFGFETAPSVPSPVLAAGQFQVLLYAGATPFPPPTLQASFGEVASGLGDGSFVLAESTVCFDIHPGAVDAPPAFALWVHGEGGADCSDHTSLTIANARAVRALWQGTVGAIDDTTPVFFRQSSGAALEPVISVFDEPVLAAADIADAIRCASTLASTSDWQAVCAPAAGAARHVRIDDIQTSGNNSYWYAVLGETGAPTTGAPVPETGKIIVTGGQSSSGDSWTWFRFGETGTTMQFNYATTVGDALYTAGPSTVCMDVGEDDGGNARLLFWATGAGGADCDDVSTLTEANALYDSEADVDTGDMWDAPLAEGATYFRSNIPATLSVGDVTVLSEGAVL